MVYQGEVRANLRLAIDRDYDRKLEAAKSKPPKALGRIVLIPEMQHKIKAAKDRATGKADGRPGQRSSQYQATCFKIQFDTNIIINSESSISLILDS